MEHRRLEVFSLWIINISTSVTSPCLTSETCWLKVTVKLGRCCVAPWGPGSGTVPETTTLLWRFISVSLLWIRHDGPESHTSYISKTSKLIGWLNILSGSFLYFFLQQRLMAYEQQRVTIYGDGEIKRQRVCLCGTRLMPTGLSVAL